MLMAGQKYSNVLQGDNEVMSHVFLFILSFC